MNSEEETIVSKLHSHQLFSETFDHGHTYNPVISQTLIII